MSASLVGKGITALSLTVMNRARLTEAAQLKPLSVNAMKAGLEVTALSQTVPTA